MESKIGLCSVRQKTVLRLEKHHMHGAQTICFNQFKLTGISNLEEWCYTGMISLSFTRSSMSVSLLFSSLFRALLHPSFTCCERVYCSKFSRTTMYVQRQSRCYRDREKIPNNWHIKLPRLIKRMFVCVFKKQCANNEGKFKVYYRKTACLFYLSAFDAMRSSQRGCSCVSVCCVHIFSFTHWYWLLLLLLFCRWFGILLHCPVLI